MPRRTGVDARVVIVAGETEAAITKQLRAAGVVIQVGDPN